MTRRPRGPSYPAEVIEAARTLYLNGLTPTDIARRFARPGNEWQPPVSTVKSWVRGLKPDDSQPWDFLAAAPEVVKAIRPAVAYALREGFGWPTQTEARWMVRASEVFTDPKRVGEVARYAAAVNEDEQQRLAASLMVRSAKMQPQEVRALAAAGVIHGGTAVPELLGEMTAMPTEGYGFIQVDPTTMGAGQ